MHKDELFQTVIEPSAQRLGLFGISRPATIEGRECIVTYKVAKVVYTDFDGKLSRYISATNGQGLPGAVVETRIRYTSGGNQWSPTAPLFLSSVPEALASAARLALGTGASARVRISPWIEGMTAPGREREITDHVADVLERALEVCRLIGPVDFLELSGNYDRVLVRPLGSELEMVSIDLHQGTITVPAIGGGDGQSWTGPVYSFEKAASEVPSVGAYLGRAHHAVAMVKEDAILAFRDAAEERILAFDAALGRRPLVGHRLEAATSLVNRLQAGLGTSLLGLSETAQMTALEWVIQLPERLTEHDARSQ